MSNINDHFFEGYYKDIWKAIIPDALTKLETEFIMAYFQLQSNAKVLDVMCGYGRHSLALGRNGIAVTAVDNLPGYIEEIKEKASAENLPVQAELTGILDWEAQTGYDLAICMGNSLNFFNAKDTLTILTKINKALKPNGQVLVNSWSLAEIVFKEFTSRNWSQAGEKKFLTESRLAFSPTRMETECTMISENGETEKKSGVDYIFSFNEMETLLQQSGFQLREAFSIPGKKKFAFGDQRIYMIAQKQ